MGAWLVVDVGGQADIEARLAPFATSWGKKKGALLSCNRLDDAEKVLLRFFDFPRLLPEKKKKAVVIV